MKKFIYRILKEFDYLPLWSKWKFAKKLWKTRENIRQIYIKKKATFRTMEIHTEAFNELAGTNYTYNYLFELIEDDR